MRRLLRKPGLRLQGSAWLCLWAASFLVCLSPALWPPGSARAQGLGDADTVRIHGVKLDRPLKAGRASHLVVIVSIRDGWHIQSNRPLSPDFIPTTLKVDAPGALAVGKVEYPAAQKVKLPFAGSELMAVFSGLTAFRVPVSERPGTSFGGTGTFLVTLRYQACNDRVCLPPRKVHSTLVVGPPLSWWRGSTAWAAAPAPAQGLEPPPGQGFAASSGLLTLALAFLGGVLLNLTPCVYPLIGVTVAYFAKQAGAGRSVLPHALLYVAGIAVTFSLLGVAAALTGGFFGRALQNPYLLVAVSLVMLVLAASSFGWVSFRVPAWLTRPTGVARPGLGGALLMGLGMGVVAAPCIGPAVVGLLLLVQQSRDPIYGFLLFFVLSLGLGLPYVALALAAGSLGNLPRSGEWLAWVEQASGLVLIGLALYFLDPVLPEHLAIRLLPFYAAGAGIWLGFGARASGAHWLFRTGRLLLGSASAIALVYLFSPHASAGPGVPFQVFSDELLAQASVRHQPVLIDFYADWCAPCREMDHTTFKDAAVLAETAKFTTLKVDLTKRSKRADQLIERFGIEGVPTFVFIDASGKVRKKEVGYLDAHDFLDDLHRVDQTKAALTPGA